MTTPIGKRIHRVALWNPTSQNPDGDGGFVTSYSEVMQLDAAILPATARDLERQAAGTVTTLATHLVILPYVADVTTASKIIFGSRTFDVVGVQNPEERNRELVVLAVEVVPPEAPVPPTSWIQSGWVQ